MYLFTFARRENFLHQFLHRVVVNCVRIDVTTELMEISTLHTDTNVCINSSYGGEGDSTKKRKPESHTRSEKKDVML